MSPAFATCTRDTAVAYVVSEGSAVSVSTPCRAPVNENVACVDPAGIVTEDGTLTAPLSVRSKIVSGAFGADSTLTVAVPPLPASTPAAGYVDNVSAFVRLVSALALPDDTRL